MESKLYIYILLNPTYTGQYLHKHLITVSNSVATSDIIAYLLLLQAIGITVSSASINSNLLIT